jgi:hypothetical protein
MDFRSFFFKYFIILACSQAFGQNIIFKDGTYLRISGGTSLKPTYFVVSNIPATYPDIFRSTGKIISEGQFNRIRIRNKTATGVFTIPFVHFNNSTSGGHVSVTVNTSSAGTQTSSGTGHIDFSTYGTVQNNTPLPVGVTSIAHIGNSIPGNGDYVYDRYWFVDVGGFSIEPTSTMSLKYIGTEKTGPLSSTLLLSSQQHNATEWNDDLLGSDNSLGTVSGIQLTSSNFTSVYTLIEPYYPLPTELIYFSAEWFDDQFNRVLVHWSTASEINTQMFGVERSSDGINWELIGEVTAAQNSHVKLDYSFWDEKPLNDYSYYRLSQIDIDGVVEYSDPVSLYKNSKEWIVFPNPANDLFTIQFGKNSKKFLNISLVDVSGKLVWTASVDELQSLKSELNVDTKTLNPGLYNLIVVSNTDVQSKKIAVSH